MCQNTESPSQGLNQLCDSSKHTPQDEFLLNTERATIERLKDLKEV